MTQYIQALRVLYQMMDTPTIVIFYFSRPTYTMDVLNSDHDCFVQQAGPVV